MSCLEISDLVFENIYRMFWGVHIEAIQQQREPNREKLPEIPL